MNLNNIPKYLINLPTRTDRLQKALLQINSFYDNSRIELKNGIIDTTPLKGIAKAHLNCIMDAKDNNYPYCIIMEDDLLFRSGAKEYSQKAFNDIPSDFDILLGGIYSCSELTPYNDYWNKLAAFNGLHWYLVNAKAYDKILAFNFNQHIDRWLVATAKLNCYVTKKLFVIQEDGFSDNVGKVTTYNDTHLNKFELL